MWYRDYRCKNWTMFKDYENNIQYGIDENKNWYLGKIVSKRADSEYLASDEEIEKALRKEAKRRGFVEGAKFLGCRGVHKDQEILIDNVSFHTPETGFDWGLYCGESWIYLKGKWGKAVKSFDSEYDVNSYERFTEKQNDILTWSGDSVAWKGSGQNLEYCILRTYFYYNSEKHGANFYEVLKEIQTKVNDEWKTFVIYKQLCSGLEFSREKEEFYNKFKQVYV